MWAQHSTRTGGFCAFTLFATLCTQGCSAHWPAFRHDGLRTGGQLRRGPLSNPARAQNLAIGWTFPASAGVPMNPPLIAFRASPVVYKKTVYIGNGNGYLYAINATDGTLRWRYPKIGQIGYSSPLVFNDHVYIGVGDHGDDPIT